jgi:hypothetical protein
MFATKKAGYDALFLTCAAVFASIGVVSLFIDATKPIGVPAQQLNHGEHEEHGGNSSG